MVEAHIVDWLNLIGRWTHLVTGTAWIGASFYFVWLDNHLETPKQQTDIERGIGGEVWSVHGGGFYHAQKFAGTPPFLPQTLHWFKWEAYSTWLYGIFLLALIYWYSAEIYLIDSSVAEIGEFPAILIEVATLVIGWLVYDRLCKSPLGGDDRKLAIALFVFISIAAWLLCHIFSGRGAFIYFGAMLGTIMVGNVAEVMIPGQKELVAATRQNRTPDPKYGRNAKQRSVHNTYFTLPVLFVMVSNHSAIPTQVGFTAPPKGIVFDTAKDIAQQAETIHQQSVVSKVMPIGNLTKMTEGERALIDAWFRAGVRTE